MVINDMTKFMKVKCPDCNGKGFRLVVDGRCIQGRRHLFTDKRTGQRINNCYWCGQIKAKVVK